MFLLLSKTFQIIFYVYNMSARHKFPSYSVFCTTVKKKDSMCQQFREFPLYAQWHSVWLFTLYSQSDVSVSSCTRRWQWGICTVSAGWPNRGLHWALWHVWESSLVQGSIQDPVPRSVGYSENLVTLRGISGHSKWTEMLLDELAYIMNITSASAKQLW